MSDEDLQSEVETELSELGAGAEEVEVLRVLLQSLKPADLAGIVWLSFVEQSLGPRPAVMRFFRMACTDLVYLFRPQYFLLAIDPYDQSEESYPMSGEEFAAAMASGQIPHPETGEIMNEVESRTALGFRPTDRFRELYAAVRHGS